MSSPSAPTNPPYGWVVVAVSFLACALAGGSMYAIVLVLKTVAAEFDWPRSIPALGFSCAMVGNGVGGILMGRWSDRVGVARPVLVGGLMVATGLTLAGSSQGAWMFLLAHAVLGLGDAAFFVPLVANATRWFGLRRGIAVALVASGQTLGGVFWPPVFRHFIESSGWRQTYLYYAVLVAMTLVPACLALRRRAPDLSGSARVDARQSDERRGVLGLPGARVLALLCAAIVGCCVAMAMPIVHLVSHASDLGYPGARAAELLSALLAGGVVGRLAWGTISDRVGGLRALLYSSACQVLLLSVFLLVESLPALYATAAFFGLAYGGIVPCYPLILRELFPVSGIGYRAGVVLLFAGVGMAIGSGVGAHLYDMTRGYHWAFATGIAFNLMNLAIVGALARRQARLRVTPALA